MANWLSSVNWDNIGKAASAVGTAAGSISGAASAIKNVDNKKTVTKTNPEGGDSGGMILPILALLLFKGL